MVTRESGEGSVPHTGALVEAALQKVHEGLAELKGLGVDYGLVAGVAPAPFKPRTPPHKLVYTPGDLVAEDHGHPGFDQSLPGS